MGLIILLKGLNRVTVSFYLVGHRNKSDLTRNRLPMPQPPPRGVNVLCLSHPIRIIYFTITQRSSPHWSYHNDKALQDNSQRWKIRFSQHGSLPDKCFPGWTCLESFLSRPHTVLSKTRKTSVVLPLISIKVSMI